jgi:hypothetical protein
MRTAVILWAITLSVCATGHLSSAQRGRAADRKPMVTLVVRPDNIAIEKQDGRAVMLVDASASEGFDGTISGTMSVSQPVNPYGIQLADGSEGRTYPFTLRAGQKTWQTTPHQTGKFAIATSPKNQAGPYLTYTVGIDPSSQFETGEPRIVKVLILP